MDPAVVAMRAIVAEAVAADPELGGGRNGRRGKPSVTPYPQRATELYLAHRLGREEVELTDAMMANVVGIVGFGQDLAGEVYMTMLGGELYEIVPG